MRILLVGALSEYAIERYYLRYFNERPGTIAEIFVAQNLFLEFYSKNAWNKIFFRLGLKRIYDRINEGLKTKICSFQPDVLFVFKGMEILPSTLKWARNKNIKIVNYNPDNPFLFSGRGSGNINVTQSISLFDLHFSYDDDILTRIQRDYDIAAYKLPFGFDVAEKTYNACVAETEIVRLCFLGNPDRKRAQFLRELAEAGIKLDVYGSNWERFLVHKNIQAFNSVYGDQFWKTLRRYRVQLNLMRPHNPNSHNMRSFEVPGIGGILLAPDTKDHRQFFKAEDEIFLFMDIQSCIEQVKRLLALSSQDAEGIRRKARDRAIHSGYDYRSRAAQALNYIICNEGR
jgi:spore maturation protein CgeB